MTALYGLVPAAEEYDLLANRWLDELSADIETVLSDWAPDLDDMKQGLTYELPNESNHQLVDEDLPERLTDGQIKGLLQHQLGAEVNYET